MTTWACPLVNINVLKEMEVLESSCKY